MNTSIISFFLFVSLASAEYRAYRYLVKDPLTPQIEPSIVTSSVQPNAYRSLNGNNLNVTLLKTWMCFGYTARKKICPYPFEISTEEIGIKAKEDK